MERLTVKALKGAALKMAGTYPNETEARADLMRRYRIAIDRLAAYEDTGLEPEEITTEPYGCAFYCNRKCNLDGDWCAEGPGCLHEINAEAANHLLEFAQIKKEGRLVVLPCKKGDTLWSFYNYPVYGIGKIVVTAVSTLDGITVINTDNYGVIPEKDIGKTVFLTREEAETALKKREEANNEAD